MKKAGGVMMKGRYHLNYNCLSGFACSYLGRALVRERNVEELRGNENNEDQRNLSLWCGFPNLIGHHPKPACLADGSPADLGLSTSVCFWHTGVSALFSQEAAFPPLLFQGREFWGGGNTHDCFSE
jgi:hypothetical protein